MQERTGKPTPKEEANHKDSCKHSGGWRDDWAVLVKLRLNVFVLITAFFGYLLQRGLGQAWDWGLVHVLLGTAACAFAASVFNQLAEIDSDALMARTANRPLPTRRVHFVTAFIVGALLAVFGVAHLWVKTGALSGLLAAVTVIIYVFIYTPLKKISSLNTLVGAVPGAIPPLIGWAGAGGGVNEAGGWYLFALLFIWQLPHFVAINWLCREEYERAGYVMWSDGDVDGRKSVTYARRFSHCLTLWAWVGPVLGCTAWWFAIAGMLPSVWLVINATKFHRTGERRDFRRFFLATLLYLPLVLITLAIAWK